MMQQTLDVSDADIARVSSAGTASPRVAIVLGSGLSSLIDVVAHAAIVPYAELTSIAQVASVAGHAGVLVLGELADVPVMVFAGRLHQYQGISALDAAWPARMAAAMGCETLIVTNAAGSVSDKLGNGDIVLISDHLNLMGTNPLVGWPGPEGGTPFVSMHNAYDDELRSLACQAAHAEGIELHEGVYAGVLGPCYETPAEVACLRLFGADVVGMSTVPEVIAARALGLRVLGLSLVTNVAAGVDLSHSEVLETARLAAGDLTRLVIAILRKL